MDKLYANGLFIATGLNDARLIFKMDTPELDEKCENIIGEKSEEVANICVPLPVLKLIAKSVNNAVEAYEERYGEITIAGNPEIEVRESNEAE